MNRRALIALAALVSMLAQAPLSHACKMAAAPKEKPAETAVAPAPRRPIDLVIALDTSNSMDGLIDSAKARLWDVVNELSRAKPTPDLRVALYTYGNSGHPAANGYVKLETPFTKDLDALYQTLSSVRTNGGDEYVARVTQAAMDELAWSSDPKALKIMFVAGNEAATQDPKLDVQAVAKKAITKGIVVNTIFCGAPNDPEAAAWAKVAKTAEGKYAFIDQASGVKVASTPMDTELATLSQKLNETYVGYSPAAAPKRAAQEASDKSAASMGAGVAAARAESKSGALYDNSDWDLVDARKNGKKMDEVATKDLPAPMQAMSAPEREKYVDGMAKKREAISKEITTLSAKRAEFVKKEQAKQAKPAADSLDAALKASIRTQAEEAGFVFEK